MSKQSIKKMRSACLHVLDDKDMKYESAEKYKKAEVVKKFTGQQLAQIVEKYGEVVEVE